MTSDYISFEHAVAANGLRMTVVSNVPSPWGEAAKGISMSKGWTGLLSGLTLQTMT